MTAHVPTTRFRGRETNRLRHARPPLVDILAVPAHRGPQALDERHALAPPQRLELRPVHAVIVIVEGPVRNPGQAAREVGLGAVAEQLEHANRDLEVRYRESRVEIIRLAHGALVQQRVEAVGRVRAVQVPPHVEA